MWGVTRSGGDLLNETLYEDRVLDGSASGGKGSNGRNELDCIRGKGGRPMAFTPWKEKLTGGVGCATWPGSTQDIVATSA